MDRDEEGHYAIGGGAQMLKVHPQTLRHYERIGLLCPQRSEGRIRLYSNKDIERAAQIRRLVTELGVNLAGVEVILNMTERMEQLQTEMEEELESLRQESEAEIQRLKDLLARVTVSEASEPRPQPFTGS